MAVLGWGYVTLIVGWAERREAHRLLGLIDGLPIVSPSYELYVKTVLSPKPESFRLTRQHLFYRVCTWFFPIKNSIAPTFQIGSKD